MFGFESPGKRSPEGSDTAPASRERGDVLYPNAYVWLIFLAAVDVLLTWLVLYTGGAEINPFARDVLQYAGFGGVILFKFGVVGGVILACEWIGRRQPGKGRALVVAAVAISGLPLVWTVPQVLLTLQG